MGIARPLTLVPLLLLTLSAAARAQNVTILSFDEGEMMVQEGPEMLSLPAQPPSGNAKAPAAPGPRLDKLKRLDFDRRPSAILAAWAEPPAPPPAAPTAGADKPAEAVPGGAASAPLDPGAAPAAPPTPPAATPPTSPESPATEAAAATATDPAAAAPLDAEAEAKRKKAADAALAAELAAKKKAEEAARKEAEAKALEAELKAFQRNVTIGDWEAVKSYLASLTEPEKKVAYDRLLASLQKGSDQRPNVPQQGQPYIEKNRFAPADVLGLAAAAPLELAKENIEKLGQILRQALDAGHQMEDFLAAARVNADAEGAALDRRRLARLLVAANEPWYMGEFLPAPEKAVTDDDREALNLISRHRLACYDKDQKSSWLEDAWRTTQAVLAQGDVTPEAKTEALTRAVDIAPKIQKELGQAWLDESFAERPERGMEILGAIGSTASTALSLFPMDSDKRFKLLKLQTTAADTLLRVAPERAAEWHDPLEVLASNWLKEALVTYQIDDSTSLGPRMQRDNYGNFYFFDGNQGFRGNTPKAIRTDQVLSIRPSDAWLAQLQDTLRPRFDMVFAQLYLKVAEEGSAFPYIEKLAATHPRQARELGAEFLRVWSKNHDPNAARGRTNQYVFMYGFDERANSIPLTRSKQDRNLAELRDCVARLKRASVELDPDQLAGAFMQAHSAAEVYRLDRIEDIFGALDQLEPAMLAALLERMRANLATVWRDPAVQEDKKTKRRQKDIEAEVVGGYERGSAVIAAAVAQHPDSWRLLLVEAAFAHDGNDYRQSLQKEPEYAARRAAAFELFRRAADAYAAALPTLEVEKETPLVFDTWFYAALGACDLKAINHKKVLAAAEIDKIRTALLALPTDRVERHVAAFVNSLTTRIGSASPAVKFRYVREGLKIVGAHERAREIQQLYDYYTDLTSEIQFRATLDGGENVGHALPFGLRLDIRHTKEIERESGGFGKYLQNQNNQGFSYNYGRPLEDYRDKFETAARASLSEHFEVLSVTFNEPTAISRPEAEEGWRRTPYAYVLLQARGPEIDRVPALRLDLDFLDTSGYAVVPVETAPVVIDARAKAGEARPVELLTFTQTLDERQAKDDRLVLDVKVSAHGLPPDFKTIADFAPKGFDVAREQDHGASVVKFDDDGASVLSERSWTLQLRAKPDLAERPKSFEFAVARLPVQTTEHFRYVDADLASVGPVVDLEQTYGSPRRTWPWWLAAAIAVFGVGWFVRRTLRRAPVAETARFEVPTNVTPFTVLGLLRDIESANGLAREEQRAISDEIARIERHFFGSPESPEPDLKNIATRWANSATRRHPVTT
ncbi:MAG: hypothetical protein JNL28_04390 [Planctomycetes bacterium]|nr:hypothetical protein [Planctomycetota bacterium]